MGDTIPLAEAVILSSSLEGILYGISVGMFGFTLWALFPKQRSKTTTNHAMIFAACALFLFSTLHIAVNIARMIVAFVGIGSSSEAWLGAVSQKTYVLKSAIYILQTLTGDGVVIYRCYKVYRSPLVILVPCILWCSVLGTGTGVLRTFSTADTNVFAHKTTVWVSAFWGTTLATNLTATMMLAYRIWRVDRSVAEMRRASSLKGVLRVVLDAGALYSITLLSALIPFICKSNGQYVVLDMITPIISIAFYMVLIRAGLARESETLKGSRRPLSSSVRSADQSGMGGSGYPMQPLEVHIAELTETDRRGIDMDTPGSIIRKDFEMVSLSSRSEGIVAIFGPGNARDLDPDRGGTSGGATNFCQIRV
ncbi:hypothetical protein GLOTRDRAFT_123329 [Gloeophyllum trabeum ATCC 11539]|uniref:Uncharacterized protein n=1 Tax=Gloeophyllum trabeum (strain ATCC 11539 / FP-39264 / Madison 617) TaxID=670483 RepID=S7PUK8_GLOTA|nr:uncharacterized protein GLOTRDRAFT_123329 [Gloeophyllum trabeum ATCC 11539]EPQ51068.1 hypothetical protein GLOTRDRAFT_123329 [Gloeophyllum trabeum ATCC 11539]